MFNINEICKKYINDENINFWYSSGKIIIDVITDMKQFAELNGDKFTLEYDCYEGEEITGFEILKEILQSFEPDITDEKVNTILSDISTKKDTSVFKEYGNYKDSYRVTIVLNKIQDEEILFYLKMKEIID